MYGGNQVSTEVCEEGKCNHFLLCCGLIKLHMNTNAAMSSSNDTFKDGNEGCLSKVKSRFKAGEGGNFHQDNGKKGLIAHHNGYLSVKKQQL